MSSNNHPSWTLATKLSVSHILISIFWLDMAIQCIVSIMDIFPSHIGHFIQHGVVAALYESMEQSMGFVDLAE